MFDSREYEWNDLTLLLGGRVVIGLLGIKYTEKIDRAVLYAKGRYGHSIQSGNISYEGEITMLQSEYEALVKAGKGSVLNLNLNAIAAYGNPLNGDVITTDTIENLMFTEASKELKTGDKNMEIVLPFIALRVVNQSA